MPYSLTDQERAVSDALSAAWNAYLLLPIEHPDDQDEFRRAIHAASAKVLMRPGRRQINAL
jgi:hypothetical protein